MEKPAVLRRNQSKSRTATRRIHTKNKSLPMFILSLVGFFIGRVALFQFMNPIALAYLTFFMGKTSKTLSIFVFTGIGIITRFEGLYTLKYMAILVVVYIIDVILKGLSIKLDRKFAAMITSTIALICGLIFAYFYQSTYFLFLAVLEGVLVFSLSFILKSGIETFEKFSFKDLSNEALISLSLVLGAIICGVADIYIGSISLKFLFSSIVILIVAYSGGAVYGATSGVLLGFILTLMGFSNYSLLGILSIAGLIGGVMKDTKKIGTMGGYLAGGLITSLYLDTGILNLGLLYSVLPALVIFFFIPEKYFPNITGTIKSAPKNSETYLEKIRELTTEKLDGFSSALKNLSLTFSDISEKKTMLMQKDVSKIIDDVLEKICDNCPNSKKCWQEDFYSSYQLSFALLEICEKKGYIKLSDLKEEHYNTCEYLETFADEINRTFEIYKNNLYWHNKIAESRELVSEQLLAVSSVIKNLSNEVDFSSSFNKSLEDRITSELKKDKIDFSAISVLETNENKYEVIINKNNCDDKITCTKDIVPVLNTILGRTMKKADAKCANQSVCRLKFKEDGKYRITTGVSMAAKEGYADSGDSYSIMNIQGDKSVLVLSDGMGSGEKAANESRAAIEILEEFIQTGFDKETAIKIINSVLVLKSARDSFATFDICSIDLYSGYAEFIKIGAVSSYILRDGEVLSIKSNSLPIGILSTVDTEITTKKLRDGDIIIMLTDGLTEIFGQINKEEWIIEALENLYLENPAEISDYLLNKAKEFSKGEIKDDMTVLVVKFTEKL